MIEFNFFEKIALERRKELKAFLMKICRSEKRALSLLSIVFCSDEYLLEINKSYLNHDYYTDIITFDYSEDRGTIHGEMFISADRVRENAATFNSTIKRELHRVIFHGLLHLCGYDDKSIKKASVMRQKEDYYLNQYF